MSKPRRHGTRRMYQLGCDCRDCYLANKRYQVERERRRAAGESTSYVDPAPVLAHLEQLVASGISERQIAIAAGLSLDTLWKVRTGRSKRMQRAKAAAVLSVKPAPTDHCYVSAGPTLEAIDRLHAMGYSKAWMVEQAGVATCPTRKRNRYVRRWVERAFLELAEFIGEDGPGATRDGHRLGNRALPNEKRTGVRSAPKRPQAEQNVRFDTELVRRLMDQDGIDASVAAEIAGYAPGSFAQLLRRGVMRPSAIDRLSTRFGVDLFEEACA